MAVLVGLKETAFPDGDCNEGSPASAEASPGRARPLETRTAVPTWLSAVALALALVCRAGQRCTRFCVDRAHRFLLPASVARIQTELRPCGRSRSELR